DARRQHNRVQRQRQAESFDQRRYDGRDRVTKRNADRAPDNRKQDTFDQELGQDIPRARADRLPQPDFARAFGHGYQHDIHDADAADQQRNAGDQPQHNGQQSGDLADGVQQIRLIDDRKILVAFKDNAVRLVQIILDVLHRLRHPVLGHSLNPHDRQPVTTVSG